jgi:hypothetical protein
MVQGGGTAEEFRQSISTLQDQMTSMVNLGKGAPEGFGHFMSKMKVDPSKLKDNFYLIDKMQEYAKEMSKANKPEVAKLLMKTLGMNDSVISSMMQGVFNQKNFKAAPIYSEGQANALKNVNRGWANLFNDAEHSMGNLNAKFGPNMIKELRGLSKEFFNLVESMAGLAERLKIVKLIEVSLGGWTKAINIVKAGIDYLTEDDPVKKEIEKGRYEDGQRKRDRLMAQNPVMKDMISKGIINANSSFIGPPSIPKKEDPKKQGGFDASKDVGNNTTVNQIINFNHPGTDITRTTSDIKKATKQVVSQVSTKAQDN